MLSQKQTNINKTFKKNKRREKEGCATQRDPQRHHICLCFPPENASLQPSKERDRCQVPLREMWREILFPPSTSKSPMHERCEMFITKIKMLTFRSTADEPRQSGGRRWSRCKGNERKRFVHTTCHLVEGPPPSWSPSPLPKCAASFCPKKGKKCSSIPFSKPKGLTGQQWLIFLCLEVSLAPLSLDCSCNISHGRGTFN